MLTLCFSLLASACESPFGPSGPWDGFDVGTDPNWTDADGTRVPPLVGPNDPPWRIRYEHEQLFWSTDAVRPVSHPCHAGLACRVVEHTTERITYLDPKGGVAFELLGCALPADYAKPQGVPPPEVPPEVPPAPSAFAGARSDAACEAAYGLALGGNVALAIENYRKCKGPKATKALAAIDTAAVRKVKSEGCRAATIAFDAAAIGAGAARAALPASCRPTLLTIDSLFP